jgi:flagellar basal-body rod protein FlgB
MVATPVLELGLPMIDAIFSQPNYIAAKKMLDVTVLRHEAIASNIANLETPNYKRLDVAPSFSSELKKAVSSNNGQQISSLQPRLEVDSNAIARSKDGNSVQLENELVQLNQNTMEHAVETQLVSSSLLRMRLAITGRSS